MSRILIVEDDEQVRQMLRMTLEAEGYEIEEAENGDVAVRLYRRAPHDLVIADLVMPEQDGIGMIRILREEYPDVKVVAISGGGRIGPQTYLKAAQRLGAVRAFTKPVDQEELLESVRELIAAGVD